MGLFDTFVKRPLHELSHPPKEQIPALDALRTCAVSFVIFQHVTKGYLANGGDENLFAKMPFVRGGFIGVDLFFVLSGYFIGKQLWREVQKTKTVHVGKFMLRRGFRIWPLYFFFFFSVLGYMLATGTFSWSGKWWSDPVFLTNYINKGIVMGSWSLCTEEQFYIITPALLLLAASRVTSIAQCRKYLIGLLVLLPVIRTVTWWFLTKDLRVHDPQIFLQNMYFPIHTHADGLVMGLLISNVDADLRKKDSPLPESAKLPRFLASGWSVLISLVLCLGLQQLHHEIFDFTAVALLFGAMAWFLINHQPKWLFFLKSRLFFLMSRLSFGMYLNHEYMQENIATWSLANIPLAHTVPALHNIVTALILLVLSGMIAVVTFCIIEHPLLELRGRVLNKKVDGTAPQAATT